VEFVRKVCSVVAFWARQAGATAQVVAQLNAQVPTVPDPVVIFPALSVPTIEGLVPQEVIVGAVPVNRPSKAKVTWLLVVVTEMPDPPVKMASVKAGLPALVRRIRFDPVKALLPLKTKKVLKVVLFSWASQRLLVSL